MKTKTPGRRKKLIKKQKITYRHSLASQLPNELVIEILLRLSVTTLAQFKCVCKSWKSLISSRKFVKEHLRTSTIDVQLVYSLCHQPKIRFLSMQSLLQNPLSIPDYESLDVTMMNKGYRILGSCNGLLCLCINHCFVKLYNPSIELKSKSLKLGSWLTQGITHHGFGYDHINDKYKLLVVVRDHGMTVTKLVTFGSNYFQTAEDFPCEPIGWLGKFLNDTLNWIAQNDQWVILFFNLATETWGQMLLRIESMTMFANLL